RLPRQRQRNRSTSRVTRESGAEQPRFFLFHAEGDATFAQVVRRHFNLDAVTGENTDVVLAHLAGDMGNDDVAVVQFYAEHGVRQGVDDGAFQFNLFFFRHAVRVPLRVLCLKEAQFCPKPGAAAKRLTLPETILEVFEGGELVFVLHFTAITYPVAQIQVLHAKPSAMVDLPENGVSAEAAFSQIRVKEGIDRRQAVTEAVDNGDGHQLVGAVPEAAEAGIA